MAFQFRSPRYQRELLRLCDDSKAAISPAASENCDNHDNACDGAIDEDDASGVPFGSGLQAQPRRQVHDGDHRAPDLADPEHVGRRQRKPRPASRTLDPLDHADVDRELASSGDDV